LGHGSWLMCVFVYVKYPTRHDRTTSKASAPHVLQLVDKRKIMVRLAEVYKSPAKELRVYQRTEHRPPVAIHLLHPTDILLVCTYCRPWLFLAVSAMSCPCTAEKRTTMWRLWPGPMMGCLLRAGLIKFVEFLSLPEPIPALAFLHVFNGRCWRELVTKLSSTWISFALNFEERFSDWPLNT